MDLFEVCAILIALTALFSFVNARYVRLPTMIGVMFLSLMASLTLALLGSSASGAKHYASFLLSHVDFNKAVFHGLLAFLLFAGSIQLDINDLLRELGAITTLALVGTALSTFAIGGGLCLALHAMGWSIPFVQCLLFGALISPTDPIAVLAILKSVGTPESLETLMAGESLFNDGVGVVFFVVLADIAVGAREPTFYTVSRLLLWEAGGGIVWGLTAGYIAYQMLRRIDNYQVEVLITLALTMGGFALGDAIGVSAPIAIVVAGLFIGNRGRRLAMSQATQEHLDTFWELIDEMLNAVLFMLIGLEVLVMPYRGAYFLAGLVAIALALAARWASVASLVSLLGLRRTFCRGTIAVLTWGGLRGGLSVAMALSLPTGPRRDLILGATYCVVVFSVLVQGLSLGQITRRACRPNPAPISVAPEVA